MKHQHKNNRVAKVTAAPVNDAPVTTPDANAISMCPQCGDILLGEACTKCIHTTEQVRNKLRSEGTNRGMAHT